MSAAFHKDPEPQGRMGQHCGVGYELVQALAVPVLHMVEQPVEVFSFIRSSLPAVAEQVIEVPAVSLPVRAVQRVVPLEPHMAKQLVVVPTVLSVAVLQQQTVEQAVDVPVLHGRGVRRLQGFLPRQSSTAPASQTVENVTHVCVKVDSACSPRRFSSENVDSHPEVDFAHFLRQGDSDPAVDSSRLSSHLEI